MNIYKIMIIGILMIIYWFEMSYSNMLVIRNQSGAQQAGLLKKYIILKKYCTVLIDALRDAFKHKIGIKLPLRQV